MSRWSATDIPDQSGRVHVVTGANSGLGLQTTLALAARGAEVVMGCRDELRGAQAAAKVRAAVPHARVSVERLDLASLASVRDFAARVRGLHPRGLDSVVANAGIMAIPRRTSEDGHELQLATNHLGHFALVGQLLPRLLQRPGARVVTVSSFMHRVGSIDFADLQSEKRYHRWSAYGRSKLANLLFSYELARRADAAGVPLVSAAAHPGYAATNLQGGAARMTGNRVAGAVTSVMNSVIGQPDARGALPTLYAVTMPDVVGGEFFGPDGLAELRGAPKRVASSAASHDAEVAARLWAESERLTGVTYLFD